MEIIKKIRKGDKNIFQTIKRKKSQSIISDEFNETSDGIS